MEVDTVCRARRSDKLKESRLEVPNDLFRWSIQVLLSNATAVLVKRTISPIRIIPPRVEVGDYRPTLVIQLFAQLVHLSKDAAG